jgi:hypothetical protein
MICMSYNNVRHPVTKTFTTLHPTTLHSTSLHFTQLHFTPLHYTSPNYTSLHFTTLHPTTLHPTSLHFTQLHFTPLYYTCPHFTSSHLNFTQLFIRTSGRSLGTFEQSNAVQNVHEHWTGNYYCFASSMSILGTHVPVKVNKSCDRRISMIKPLSC